jgi:hypothetical protein
VLPRIVVAARRNDVLGRLLARSVSASAEPFTLEFCGERGALPEYIRVARPAALVIGSHDDAGVVAAPFVQQLKLHYPTVPVVVACMGEETHGRDVLSLARAGAEHFAFSAVDNFRDVLRGLVAPGAAEHDERTPSGRLGPSSMRRHRFVARQRTPSAPAVLPGTVPPMLRRLVHASLGPEPLTGVHELAAFVGTTTRTLQREMARRHWPSPRELLYWGRLFRGALVAAEARLSGHLASVELIAHAAGFANARTASRAYHARAGVGVREVQRTGVAALLPAFFAATGLTADGKLAS